MSSMVFRASHILAAVVMLAACAPAAAPRATPERAGAITLVEGAQFDAERARFPTTTAAEPLMVRRVCQRETPEQCREAALATAKAETMRRGRNLIVVLRESLLESDPPEYEATLSLYRLRTSP